MKPPHFILFYMKILKIIFSIFFLKLYSIAFSQIEILKTVSISGASFKPGIKDKYNNTYVGLTLSPSVNDSLLIENKFVTKSKGKIDPSNTSRRASAFVLIGLDSNYNLTTVHQIYGNADVFSSDLFLASDTCIYFSIVLYDTVFINERPIFDQSKKGTLFLLKYNIQKDTLSIIKKITGTDDIVGFEFFKEFNNHLYFSFYFSGTLKLEGLEFVAGLGQADLNLLILDLNWNTYNIEKWYYFEGDDQKVIRDYSIDHMGDLHVIGEFWGSIIISNRDTIRNTNGRSYDGFYFRIDSNKNVIAKKRIGGPNDQFPKQIYLNNDGRVDILGSYNAPFVDVDGVKVINTSNSYNIFTLSLDSQSKILSLNQLNKETFIIPNNFSLFSEEKNTYFSAGYFYDKLYIGNNQYLKNPNGNYDAFILLMDANCGPMDGYQISGMEGESASIINNGNGLYTIWGDSESDTTYFVNFDQKFKTGLGHFFMDVRFKSSTGVEEIEKGLKNIEIYPNPSIDFVTIKTFDLNKSMEMEIFAIDGKNVYQKEIDVSTDEIIFRWPLELKSGIYFYKFKSKNATKIIKVLKQ